MVLERSSLGTFSIVGITDEELALLGNAILNANLPDKRNLYNIKSQIDRETK
jgi:hypothetical protein